MTNHSCQSDSVLLWKAIATGHNDILELISTILDELLELNGKFLLCCDETNANLDEIINKLDVLIQNLIDCCEGICDRLDTIIEILEEKYPEGVEYGITYDDYICIDEWDCDVGGEYLECNFEDCLPEPPEIEYGVTWDDYVCVEEAETTTTTTVLPTTTTTEEPTTTTTTIIEPETDYGYLYNWWAAIGDTDGDNVADTSIASTGWHLPTETEVDTLLNDLYGIEELGSTAQEEEDTALAMKSTNSNFWINVGNNSSGLDFRGTGGRNYSTGIFQDITTFTYIVTSTLTFSSYFRAYSISHNNSITRSNGYKKHGRNVRLIKDSTTLSDGETGTYTGNNGITYPTICVGTQEWLAKDLKETKFRDGSDIPYIDNQYAEDNAEWAAATSAAYCIYPIT